MTLARLSPREAEVMELMAQGLTNPQIADTLHIGTETVKTHATRVIKKLGVRNRAQVSLHLAEAKIQMCKRKG